MLYSRTLLQVHIYHHFINNTFRVVGRKLQDHEVRPDQSTKFETFFASEDQQNFALDVWNIFCVGRSNIECFLQVVINCAILKGLKYNQATPTFHQVDVTKIFLIELQTLNSVKFAEVKWWSIANLFVPVARQQASVRAQLQQQGRRRCVCQRNDQSLGGISNDGC